MGGAVDFVSRWTWSDFGRLPTPGGLALLDVDQDGRSEIIADATRSYDHDSVYFSQWFILDAEPDLRQTSSSLPTTDYRRLPRTTTADGGLLVAIAGSDFEVIDPRTLDVLRSIPTGTEYVLDYTITPLTPSGDLRLISCGSDQLRAHDLLSGAVVASLPIAACDDLAAGNLDDDPAIELAITRGAGGIWVVDGATFDIEWSEPGTPTWSPVLAQVTPDAALELVLADSNGVRAIEPTNGETLWLRADIIPFSIAAGELDETGSGTELAVAGSSELPLQVLSAADGTTRTISSDWDFQVHELIIGDVAATPGYEIVASVGSATRNGEAFLIVDLPGLGVLDALHRVLGPFTGLSVADVDADGDPELAMVAHQGPSALTVDPATRAVTAQVVPVEDWSLGTFAATMQLDQDPQLELCSVNDCLLCGLSRLRCQDLLTFEIEWEVQLPDDTEVRALEALDLDGDLQDELLLSTQGDGVYAFEGATGWLRWRTPALPSTGYDTLRIADVDDDAALEILAGGGTFSVFRAEDGALEYGPFASAACFELGDLDGTGGPEVVAMAFDGTLHVLDPTTGELGPEIAAIGSGRCMLRIGDFDRDGSPDFANISNSGRISVWTASPSTLLWESPILGYLVAIRGDLVVVDIDRDTIPELLVDTGFGFALFEGPEYPLLLAGFESGDTSEWTHVQP